MTPRVRAIYEAARTLTREDQEAIVAELISSLDGPPPSPEEQAEIEAVWEAEVARRIEAVERGEVTLIDGDEVYARLREGRFRLGES